MTGRWRRLAGPVALGLGGVAILMALGFWQLDRRDQKLAAITARDVRIDGPPGPIPDHPVEARDQYQSVSLTGDLGPAALRMLTTAGGGAAYRIISTFETSDGRRVMVDRGVARDGADWPRTAEDVLVRGNLHWPDEIGPMTPAPDLDENVWFGRDIPAMADVLDTEPVLVVASLPVTPGGPIRPQPVSSASIPNNHLGYAVQWFGMALAWAGMAVFLARRTMRG